jgi:hypothetical protein
MFKSAERIRETSTTTGTGTYTLGGAPTGYQPVSSIAANSYGPFFITDGTNWEVIIGQYLSGPDRLTRDAVIASSNAGAAVNWGVGTRTIRSGWPAWLATPRYLTKSVAGGAGTTVLTQNEQRGHVLEFTGALTGNRILEVDATPWDWTVYNNTSGAFSLTLRVTGQTGVTIPQGKRVLAMCDGTDVRSSVGDVAGGAMSVSGALTVTGLVDLSGAAAGQIKFPATQNASSDANTLDDYEEGTYSPTCGGAPTFTKQTGKYIKIGKLVFFSGRMKINTMTGPDSAMNGAPFTPSGGDDLYACSCFITGGTATNFVCMQGLISSASGTIFLEGMTAAGSGFSNLAVIDDGTDITMTGSYQANG